MEAIAEGNFYSGEFQKMEREMTRRLQENGFLEALNNESIDISRDENTKKLWTELRSIWEEYPQQMGLREKNLFRNFLNTNYLDRIQNLKKVNSPFVHKLSSGYFQLSNLPHPFTQDTFEAAKKNGIDNSRVRFHHGQIDQVASIYKSFMFPQGFDFISISNSFDLDQSQAIEKIAQLLPFLTKGGIIVGKLGNSKKIPLILTSIFHI